MTTSVIVNAGHGWPVDLVFKDPKTGDILSTQRIDVDGNQTIYVHRGADVLIHEVQPEEMAAVSYDDEASAAADLADAQKVSEITGDPIPDPLIDQVVKIDPETNQIVDETSPVAAVVAATPAADAAPAAVDTPVAVPVVTDGVITAVEVTNPGALVATDDVHVADSAEETPAVVEAPVEPAPAAVVAETPAETPVEAAVVETAPVAAEVAPVAVEAAPIEEVSVETAPVVQEVVETPAPEEIPAAVVEAPVEVAAEVAVPEVVEAPVETPVAETMSDPAFGTDPVDEEAPKLDQQS
jgi:hypothetical protein